MTELPPIKGTGVANKPGKKEPKKKKKQGGKSTAADSSSKAPRKGQAKRRPAGETKVAKAVKTAKTAASKIKESPVVAEIVAAALVATAAALKDPQKARRIAAEAGDELKRAGGKAARKSDAFWAMALDIARRSVDALGVDDGTGGSPKPKPKK